MSCNIRHQLTNNLQQLQQKLRKVLSCWTPISLSHPPKQSGEGKEIQR
uniref:Uncharacterized protein n=1 Tax=Rhizophora mucronata TaxID=61149 RepID=A0A2P2J4J1_RHIMU